MAAGSSAADRNKTVNRQVCGRQKKHRGWYRQLDPPTAVCKRQQKHRGRYRQLDPSTAVCNASKNIAAGANNLSRRQHSLILNPIKNKAGKCYYLGSGSKCMVNGVFCMVPNFVSRYRFFATWYRKRARRRSLLSSASKVSSTDFLRSVHKFRALDFFWLTQSTKTVSS